MEKLAYEASSLQTVEAASTDPDHVATRTKMNKDWVTLQQTQRSNKINHVETSSGGQFTHEPMKASDVIAVIYNTR